MFLLERAAVPVEVPTRKLTQPARNGFG